MSKPESAETSKASEILKAESKAPGYQLVLDPKRRPGVRRVGNIIAGQPVRISSAAEAVRLVDHKGLSFVDKSDEQQARAALKSANGRS